MLGLLRGPEEPVRLRVMAAVPVVYSKGSHDCDLRRVLPLDLTGPITEWRPL
jgi:hypothetical protein